MKEAAIRGGKAAIVGIGETEFLRRSPRSLLEMTITACEEAISDAGLAPADIDGFVCNRNSHGADEVAFALGIDERPYSVVTDTLGGTAPAGEALVHAQLAIEAGLAKHVLVYYGYQGSKPGGPYGFHAREPLKADLEMPVGYFSQPSYFAMIANRYAHEYGLTEEELASIAITYRKWAMLTPTAQKRKPLDLESYRESPMISTPLRVADCCLLTDGASAYIVSSAERASDMPHTPVIVRSVGIGTHSWPQSMVFTQNADLMAFPGRESARIAFEDAGMTPNDLDLAQIYDGFSISALIQTEMLGLCEPGEGAKFYHAGHSMPGGKMPINTSGGHMSGGYLPGITLMTEAVRQLRHDRGEAQVANAEVCSVSGLGGNSHSTAILTRR